MNQKHCPSSGLFTPTHPQFGTKGFQGFSLPVEIEENIIKLFEEKETSSHALPTRYCIALASTSANLCKFNFNCIWPKDAKNSFEMHRCKFGSQQLSNLLNKTRLFCLVKDTMLTNQCGLFCIHAFQ